MCRWMTWNTFKNCTWKNFTFFQLYLLPRSLVNRTSFSTLFWNTTECFSDIKLKIENSRTITLFELVQVCDVACKLISFTLSLDLEVASIGHYYLLQMVKGLGLKPKLIVFLYCIVSILFGHQVQRASIINISLYNFE